MITLQNQMRVSLITMTINQNQEKNTIQDSSKLSSIKVSTSKSKSTQIGHQDLPLITAMNYSTLIETRISNT